MANTKSARAAGEAAVGDERNRLAGTLTVERRRRRQHLAHAGAADRALVANDDDVAFVVLAGIDRRERLFLAVEYPRRAAELQLLQSRHLHDGAVGRERASETDDAASRRDRIGDRIDDPLVGIEFHLLEVLLHRAPRRGDAVT